MKTMSLIVLILLVFSCGGDTNPKDITIETKSKFQDYKNKEIVIYSNISESAIQEYKTKFFVSNEKIQSFSNEIKCKDINPNYIQTKIHSYYSYNNFIACRNYDMSKTDYSGSKTYIMTVGDLHEQHASDDTPPPSFSSNFEALFAKERIVMPAIFKNEYSISEIKKNHSNISIFRNVNNKGLSEFLRTKKDSLIYKLPKNETITCEKIGYSPDDAYNSEIWIYYRKKYTVNNKVKWKSCSESTILESYNDPNYGSDTYIIVKYYK